jgi:hypothetical protein
MNFNIETKSDEATEAGENCIMRSLTICNIHFLSAG